MRRFYGPLLAAVAGLVLLLILFPRYDPSARLDAVLNRDRAIEKTRQLAAQNGINVTGWRARAVDSLENATGPVRIRVQLSAPKSIRSLDAEWYPNGELASSRMPDEPRRFTPPKVKVKTQADGQVHVSVADSSSSREKQAFLPLRILEVLWRIAIVVYFLYAAVRRRLRYRIAVILALVLIIPIAGTFWGGTASDKAKIVSGTDLNEESHFGVIFWIFVYAAIGYSLRTTARRQKWTSVEVAVSGGLLSRQVGWSVAVGMLSGIGIAAIPYLVAASGLSGAVLNFRSVDLLAARIPSFPAWHVWEGVLAAGLFGFTYPVLERIRRRPLRLVMIGIVGLSAIGAHTIPFTRPFPNLLVSVLFFAAYLFLYLRADVLAVMVAMVAANSAIAPFVLLSQAEGAVRVLALPPLLFWGLALAAAMNFALRGREGIEPPSPPSLEPADERETKTGRLRLEAEFEVARKAQDGALPAAAPAIAGYTLAGSCQPARQVGGDLYDYFPLSDGRWGVAVADVSGKGVPAALYMMVTKGLLAATTRESNDLRYILQQVNLYLHRACRKKVFVTLAAVVLDPVNRRLQHGRAGHNPILWRRTGRNESVFLKPPGLALGMTAGERFNRMLKIEELELEPGDAIVLYSDGVTEAVDSKMDQYGEPRLVRAVEATDGRPAEDSRVAILRDLAEFTGTTPARDDVTVVVLRVSENGMLI